MSKSLHYAPAAWMRDVSNGCSQVKRQTSNPEEVAERLLMSACIQENTVRGNPLKFIDQWVSLS